MRLTIITNANQVFPPFFLENNVMPDPETVDELEDTAI